MSSRFNASRTIYVGNLPADIREREVEDLFYKYGRIVDIDLKVPPRPPGFAFVEFEDPRDAEDAIRGRDGYEFDGHRLRVCPYAPPRVEMAHGGRAAHAYGGFGRGGGGPPRGGSISRRTEFRVIVKNLPASASWQDLKDHMRKAGDVCFAQVFKDGHGMMGIIDYSNEDDMNYAVRKLDDSEFRNPFSKGAFIRVYREKDYKERERDRSYSRSPSRGRSYSRSRSRSGSPRGRRGRTPSESPPPKKGKDEDEEEEEEEEDKDREVKAEAEAPAEDNQED